MCTYAVANERWNRFILVGKQFLNTRTARTLFFSRSFARLTLAEYCRFLSVCSVWTPSFQFVQFNIWLCVHLYTQMVGMWTILKWKRNSTSFRAQIKNILHFYELALILKHISIDLNHEISAHDRQFLIVFMNNSAKFRFFFQNNAVYQQSTIPQIQS